jgi:hypothetical protein
MPIRIKVPSALRRWRPDSFPSDETLRLRLTLWEMGIDMPPELMPALYFRLADLIDEKHAKRTSVRWALVAVEAMTSDGWSNGRWSEGRAIAQVAHMRGLETETLKKAWQRYKKKRSANPGTKSPRSVPGQNS